MSIWWAIRLTLVVLLFILIIILGKFLKNRGRYSSILENISINLVYLNEAEKEWNQIKITKKEGRLNIHI